MMIFTKGRKMFGSWFPGFELPGERSFFPGLSLFGLLFFATGPFGLGQTVSFTTDPAAQNGSLTICTGNTVTFTNTSTGQPAGVNYVWNFSGGSPSSATGVGPHTITYNNTGTYTATLSANGGPPASVSVVVINSTQINPTIALSANSGWTSSVFNSQNFFSYCDNSAVGAAFFYSTTTPNTGPGTQHIINWGDGTPQTNYTGTNLTDDFHLYLANGIYQVSYTVILAPSCSLTKTFNVFIGSNPTGSLINSGTPVLCNPSSVQYSVIPGPQNTNGTIYTFQVNDGSPPQVFTHQQLINQNFLITHVFDSVSCGTSSNINGTIFVNSFQASITVSNPCGTSSGAFGPINIQAKPIASFTAAPSNDAVCINTTVNFTDNTTPGTNISGSGPGFACNSLYKKYWQITGPSGVIPVAGSGVINPNPFVTVTGNLGSNLGNPANQAIWTSTATTNLAVTFNTPGTYTISLFVSGTNACGITSFSKTICVLPPVDANFTLTDTVFCLPFTLNPDNLSSGTSCNNSNLYNWSVIPTTPSGCAPGGAAGFNFGGGTNNASFEPQLNFTGSGFYNIRLIVGLQTPVVGNLCRPDTLIKTVKVKDKPQVTIPPFTQCENIPITLNANVLNCLGDIPATYFWNFAPSPPASIASSTVLSPTVTYNTNGIFPFSFTATNECGPTILNQNITIEDQAEVTATGPSGVCVNSPIALTGTLAGSATSGTWTSNVPGGSFTPNATTLNATYNPPANYTGPVTLTLTTNNPPGPCPAVTAQVTIQIDQQATVSINAIPTACQDSPISITAVLGGAASSVTWTSSIGGTFANPNAANTTFTPPAGFVGSVTLTATTNDPVGPCLPATANRTFQIITLPTVNAGVDQPMCQGANIVLSGTFGGSATGATWSSGAGGTFSPSANALNATWTPPAAFSGTATLTLTTTGMAPCAAATDQVLITVAPKAFIANTTLTICSGQSFNFLPSGTAPNSIPGGTVYTWTVSNNANIQGQSASASPQSSLQQTLTSTSTSPQTITYQITPLSGTNPVCPGAPFNLTVTVNPNPVVQSVNPPPVCNGTAASISFTGVATSYFWTNSNTLINLGASGTGNINFTAVNTGTLPATSTVQVTPQYTNASLTCTGTPISFTITVNPTPTVVATPDQTVCNGENTTLVTFSGSVSGTVFNWTNSNTNIGLNAASGSGDIAPFQGINNTNTAQTANINVTPSAAGCNGTADLFVIRVNPTPAVTNASLNQSVCSGQNSIQVNWTSSVTAPATTTYAWSFVSAGSNLSGFNQVGGTGALPQMNIINSGNTPQQVIYSVVPTSSNCPGPAVNYTITVNPVPNVILPATQTLCSGQAGAAANLTSSVAGTSFNWTVSSSSPSVTGFPAGPGSGNIPSFTPQNGTTANQTITFLITPTVNGCPGTPVPYVYTVLPVPITTFSPPRRRYVSTETPRP
jgi:PKD repeat protein